MIPTPTPHCRERGFVDRHVGPDADEINRILPVIGVDSLDELADRAVPAVIAERPDANGLDALPAPMSETQVRAELADLAGRNVVARSMIGLGY